VIAYNGRAESPVDRVEEISLEVPPNRVIVIGYDRDDDALVFKVRIRPLADIWIDAVPPAAVPADPNRRRDEGPIIWLLNTYV